MQPFEKLRSILIGKAYWSFTVGSAFDLDFDGFILSSHELLCPDEGILGEAFAEGHPMVKGAWEPKHITKSAILAACLKKVVTDVKLLDDASLVLKFENGMELMLPTDTPVVDWHWAVTEDGRDPYLGCMFACFGPGEIQGGTANNSFKPTPRSGAA